MKKVNFFPVSRRQFKQRGSSFRQWRHFIDPSGGIVLSLGTSTGRSEVGVSLGAAALQLAGCSLGVEVQGHLCSVDACWVAGVSSGLGTIS